MNEDALFKLAEAINTYIRYKPNENVTFELVPSMAKMLAEVLMNNRNVIRCKDCRFRDDPNSVISLWLPCQVGNTEDDWYCGCALPKEGEVG